MKGGNLFIWVLAAILVFVVLIQGSQVLPLLAQQGGNQGGNQRGVRGDLAVYYTLKSFLSTLNIVLLSILLVLYVSTYSQARSEFLVGLIIFDVAMLLYALTSDPLIYGGFGFHGAGLGPFAMLPDLFSLVAVSVLLLQAVRYR
jgi:hypothetical protein